MILITGSAGRIGQAVVQALRDRNYPVRGFDLVPTPGVADQVVGSLLDNAALGQAMAGVEVLIHLAATPDDADFETELLPNNLLGVYRLFEAARATRVRRLILASTGQVVWHQSHRGPWPVGIDVQPTPRYWYAACKLFLEAAGRAFAEAHGMEVLAVRLGWCPRTLAQVEEIRTSPRSQDVYLSPNDAGRFFACAVAAAKLPGFHVVYATSRPVNQERADLRPARELLGYEPGEQWPMGIEIITR